MATFVTPVENFKTVLQLPEATAPTGAEIIEVIQDGESRQMPLSEIVTGVDQLPVAGARTGAELVQVLQDGEKRQMSLTDVAKFDRYDLANSTSTGVCDLSKNQAFVISNTTAGAKAISFINAPAGRSIAVLIKIVGNVGSVTWPAGIVWNQDTAPEMGATATLVVLYWDGTTFMGSQGATK